jgi:amidase
MTDSLATVAPFATATSALAALDQKEISAVELTRSELSRIERLNPRLNAIVNVLAEPALAQAQAADEARGRGADPGPLGGLPLTIKDTFEIAGVRTTAGFEPLRGHVPAEDAAAVARLRAAGAVFLGQTNVPPLASDWQCDNPIYGRTTNPWSAEHTPGGSSGGSSAAVAAGMGFMSLGSDIGGSIRIPAAWTGIYGHKPSLNVVPLRGHIPPMPGVRGSPPSLPVAGPLARGPEDLGLAVRVLGGPDGEDAVAWKWALPEPRRTKLREFRVGFVRNHPDCPLTSEVASVYEEALAAIGRTGVTMTEGWPEGVDPRAQFETYRYLVSVAAFGEMLDESKLDEVRSLAATVGDSLEIVIARAQTDPWKRIGARNEERMTARAIWQRWFRTHDVFLLPVVFTTAIPHVPTGAPIPTPNGDRPYMDLLWWIASGTLTGCPATVAPIGRTRSGLPVGIQILGPYLEDATPIGFAGGLADVVGGFEAPPGFR